MKIKNNIIFSLIFTTSLTTFIIWNRFIRIRLPRIIEYHVQWSPFDKIIMFIFLLYLISFLYYFLKGLKVIPRPNSRIKPYIDKFLAYLSEKYIINVIYSFIHEHVINGPRNVYDLFYKYIYIRPFIWYCGKMLFKYHNKAFIPYILFIVLPKVIIVCCLFIEVTLFNQLHYFYRSLILSLIPLLFNIILYMIEHHCKDEMDQLHEYFEFKFLDKEDKLEITYKEFLDPQELQYQYNLQRYGEENWLRLQYMYSVVQKIYQEKEKYRLILYPFIYGMYTISFGIYIIKISSIL